MFKRFTAFAAVLIAAVLIFTVEAQDEPFEIGDEVTVLGEAAVLMIYSEPDTSSSIVEATVSGITLTIVDGPEESDEGIFWQIRSPSGIEGWILYLIDDAPTIGAIGDDEDFTESSSTLTTGEQAIVLTSGFVLMYENPDTGSQALEALISNFEVALIEGPEIIDDQRWWYVESPSGNQGWVLENIDGETVLYTEDQLITLTPTVAPTPMPTPTRVPVVRFNGRVNTTRLNVRTGPGPEYDQVTQLSDGASITVIGRSDDGTWVQLDASDQQWININFVVINGNILDLPVAFVEIGEWDVAGSPTGARAVAETVLRIRGGPGNQYRQLSDPDTVREGATVDIIGISADGLFYKVNIDNRSGWINAQFVRLTGNVNAAIPVIQYSDALPSNGALTATPQAVIAATATASSDQCPGALPQRLQVGGQAQQALSTDPVRVQNEPGGGTTNFFLYPGNVADVIAGPRCQNIGNSPVSWWQIRGVNDWTGWVAEGDGSQYFLQPYSP